MHVCTCHVHVVHVHCMYDPGHDSLILSCPTCPGCVIQVVIIFNNNIMEQVTTLLQFKQFTSLLVKNTSCCTSRKGAKCQAQSATDEFQVEMSHTNRNLRLFLASTINIVGLAIVTTTIPVFLCTSETYMDFVLNAAATLFIVELDNLKVDTKMVIMRGVDVVDVGV